MKIVLVCLALLAQMADVGAQSRVARAADQISTGLVAVNLAADAIASARHHCLKQFVYKNLLTLGAVEGTKLVVHEDRPDHSDDRSFPSMHAGLAMANTGWNFTVGFSVALGAGTGRVVAQKHHPTDVLVGLGAGLGATYLFPCGEQ